MCTQFLPQSKVILSLPVTDKCPPGHMLGINLQCIKRRKPIDINSTEWAEYKDFVDQPTDSKPIKLKIYAEGMLNSTSKSNVTSHDPENNSENGSVSQEWKRYL